MPDAIHIQRIVSMGWSLYRLFRKKDSLSHKSSNSKAVWQACACERVWICEILLSQDKQLLSEAIFVSGKSNMVKQLRAYGGCLGID